MINKKKKKKKTPYSCKKSNSWYLKLTRKIGKKIGWFRYFAQNSKKCYYIAFRLKQLKKIYSNFNFNSDSLDATSDDVFNNFNDQTKENNLFNYLKQRKKNMKIESQSQKDLFSVFKLKSEKDFELQKQKESLTSKKQLIESQKKELDILNALKKTNNRQIKSLELEKNKLIKDTKLNESQYTKQKEEELQARENELQMEKQEIIRKENEVNELKEMRDMHFEELTTIHNRHLTDLETKIQKEKEQTEKLMESLQIKEKEMTEKNNTLTLRLQSFGQEENNLKEKQKEIESKEEKLNEKIKEVHNEIERIRKSEESLNTERENITQKEENVNQRENDIGQKIENLKLEKDKLNLSESNLNEQKETLLMRQEDLELLQKDLHENIEKTKKEHSEYIKKQNELQTQRKELEVQHKDLRLREIEIEKIQQKIKENENNQKQKIQVITDELSELKKINQILRIDIDQTKETEKRLQKELLQTQILKDNKDQMLQQSDQMLQQSDKMLQQSDKMLQRLHETEQMLYKELNETKDREQMLQRQLTETTTQQIQTEEGLRHELEQFKILHKQLQEKENMTLINLEKTKQRLFYLQRRIKQKKTKRIEIKIRQKKTKRKLRSENVEEKSQQKKTKEDEKEDEDEEEEYEEEDEEEEEEDKKEEDEEEEKEDEEEDEKGEAQKGEEQKEEKEGKEDEEEKDKEKDKRQKEEEEPKGEAQKEEKEDEEEEKEEEEKGEEQKEEKEEKEDEEEGKEDEEEKDKDKRQEEEQDKQSQNEDESQKKKIHFKFHLNTHGSCFADEKQMYKTITKLKSISYFAPINMGVFIDGISMKELYKGEISEKIHEVIESESIVGRKDYRKICLPPLVFNSDFLEPRNKEFDDFFGLYFICSKNRRIKIKTDKEIAREKNGKILYNFSYSHIEELIINYINGRSTIPSDYDISLYIFCCRNNVFSTSSTYLYWNQLHLYTSNRFLTVNKIVDNPNPYVQLQNNNIELFSFNSSFVQIELTQIQSLLFQSDLYRLSGIYIFFMLGLLNRVEANNQISVTYKLGHSVHTFMDYISFFANHINEDARKKVGNYNPYNHNFKLCAYKISNKETVFKIIENYYKRHEDTSYIPCKLYYEDDQADNDYGIYVICQREIVNENEVKFYVYFPFRSEIIKNELDKFMDTQKVKHVTLFFKEAEGETETLSGMLNDEDGGITLLNRDPRLLWGGDGDGDGDSNGKKSNTRMELMLNKINNIKYNYIRHDVIDVLCDYEINSLSKEEQSNFITYNDPYYHYIHKIKTIPFNSIFSIINKKKRYSTLSETKNLSQKKFNILNNKPKQQQKEKTIKFPRQTKRQIRKNKTKRNFQERKNKSYSLLLKKHQQNNNQKNSLLSYNENYINV